MDSFCQTLYILSRILAVDPRHRLARCSTLVLVYQVLVLRKRTTSLPFTCSMCLLVISPPNCCLFFSIASRLWLEKAVGSGGTVRATGSVGGPPGAGFRDLVRADGNGGRRADGPLRRSPGTFPAGAQGPEARRR